MVCKTSRAILQGRFISPQGHAKLFRLAQKYNEMQKRCHKVNIGAMREGDVGEMIVFLGTGVKPNNVTDLRAVDGVHASGFVEIKTDFTRLGADSHLVDRTTRYVPEENDDGPWRAVNQGAKYIVFVNLPKAHRRTSCFVYDARAFRDRCEALIEKRAYRMKRRVPGRNGTSGLQYSFRTSRFHDLRLDLTVLD